MTRTDTARPIGRVVVGVDGSPASLDALRWATRQAALTGATVEAVTAWRFPATYGADVVVDGDWESNGTDHARHRSQGGAG